MDAAIQLALITGGNKGIGFAAAKRLSRAGVTVLLGARDPDRGEKARAKLAEEGLTVLPIQMEVTDANSIAAAVSKVENEFGRLDILVNNAGGGFFPNAPSSLDVDQLRAVFDTNFFGTFMVTKAFLPLLRKSAAGRIINVASGTGSLFMKSNPQWRGYSTSLSAYAMSKTAVNALTVQLACELHGTTIKVNSVEPGFTATDLTGQQGFYTADEASAVIERYALIGPDGPTGGFYDINGPMPW